MIRFSLLKANEKAKAFWPQRMRGEDGNATIDFVLVVPAFLMLLMASVEAGVTLTRDMMLERALDISLREVRMGSAAVDTHAELKERICQVATLVNDCGNSLLLELRPVSTTTWGPLDDAATCVDRTATISPQTTFQVGVANELMLVRACLVIDPIFPTSGLASALPLDASGGFRIVATSAFVNEP